MLSTKAFQINSKVSLAHIVMNESNFGAIESFQLGSVNEHTILTRFGIIKALYLAIIYCLTGSILHAN